ncbi:YdaU family protein [Limimaricola cinnabarinus]|uniref:YdaU family protein n=1 Tax=Limimaricola cinnabarinus TaxID=1125964 RepID=UPI002FE2687B
MTEFNAQRARAKRPCPLWVDAFQRDTQHLAADEVGAYMLILMAMWTRESCDFPDDDKRLARVSRVSPRLWGSRIGPTLREFFTVHDGALISKRLRQEASFVEEGSRKQSDRKAGTSPKSGTYAKPQGTQLATEENDVNSDKCLKDNEAHQSTDVSGDITGDQPTQLPNNPTVDGGGSSAGDQASEPSEVATIRERLLEAIGVDPVSGITGPNGRQIGTEIDMAIAKRWSVDLGLTLDQVLTVIREVMARKPDGPPNSFKFFDKPMARFAAEMQRLASDPLSPASPSTRKGARHDRNGTFDQRHDELLRRIAAGEIDRGPDPSDPWAY